jgi:zinc protease
MTVAAQRGLQVVRRQLASGVVGLAKQARTTPSVTIHASLDAGSAYDPQGRHGLAHFLARVIDRGTFRRSAHGIADELDSRGVSLTIGVTRHQLSLVCTCLTDDIEPILELMTDIIRNPAFPETEIETRRGEILTAIQQDADNPAVVATEELMERLYPGGHPYGRRTRGTSAIVAGIDRDELAGFHRGRARGGALTMAIVGDVEPARALDLVERFLGDWEGGAPERLIPPAAARETTRQRIVRPMMNKAQADIAYGFVAMARTDPGYHAAAVMNNVLGQYALGGRLGDEIRERLGMAYYIFSALDANIGRGPLVIRAGVNPRNVDRTIDAIDREVAAIASRGMSDREVADSKQYLMASIPRTLETNAAIAAFLQMLELFQLGLDYDLRLPGLIADVTAEQANQAARELLDKERATIVIAGPYDGERPSGEAA